MEEAIEGGLSELEVAGFAIERESEGGVFEVLANLLHVADAIAQIGLVMDELQELVVFEIDDLGSDRGEPRVLEVFANAREVDGIEEESG